MKRPLRKTGFTLIELLVVIAIVALLAGVFYPVLAEAHNHLRAQEVQPDPSSTFRYLLESARWLIAGIAFAFLCSFVKTMLHARAFVAEVKRQLKDLQPNS